MVDFVLKGFAFLMQRVSCAAYRFFSLCQKIVLKTSGILTTSGAKYARNHAHFGGRGYALIYFTNLTFLSVQLIADLQPKDSYAQESFFY